MRVPAPCGRLHAVSAMRGCKREGCEPGKTPWPTTHLSPACGMERAQEEKKKKKKKTCESRCPTPPRCPSALRVVRGRSGMPAVGLHFSCSGRSLNPGDAGELPSRRPPLPGPPQRMITLSLTQTHVCVLTRRACLRRTQGRHSNSRASQVGGHVCSFQRGPAPV